MTKKLEELLDLPTDDQSEIVEPEMVAGLPVETDKSEEFTAITTQTASNLDKIDAALPAIRGLEASDTEMDELAALATGSYKDLIALGMNVEARVAADILGSASQFLGHAITAKQAKINKKIKMIELQLKKAKLDQSTGAADESQATGTLIDRNELLAEILKSANPDSDTE